MIPNLAAFPHAWFHSLRIPARLLPLGLITLFLNACLSQPASQLEAMGITLTPYADFDLTESSRERIITSVNSSQFTLSGDCGEAGGAIELIEPASVTQETVCGSDKRWSITLDLSGFADQVFDFKIRHTRADGSRYIEVEAPSYFKITQNPAPVAGLPSSSGVNPAQSGSTIVVNWLPGTDSSGAPLVGYEVSVSSGALGSGTLYQEWSSVGASTSTTVAVPSGSSSEGSVFYVNIRGNDQAGQTTAPQSTSYEIDATPPTFSSTLTPGSSITLSTTSGPNFNFAATDGSGSGVSRFEYRVIDLGSSHVIRNWTTVAGSATALQPSGLTLTAGSTYQIEIKAIDLAGNESISKPTATWSVASPTLVFTAKPSTASVGSNFSATVALQDGQGTTITSESGSVLIQAFSDSGCTTSASGTLSGGSATAAAGVASLSSLQWNATGTIYLKATSAGFAVACSTGINVGPATNPVASVITPSVWLKADAITGVSSGSTLTSWSDSSGNSRNFGSGVAPTYQTQQINGLPAVTFGGSQYLKVAGSALTKPASFTVISVLAPSSTTYTGYVYGAISGGTSASMWGSLGQDTGSAQRYWGNGSTYATATSNSVFTSANQFQILSQTYAAGGTTDTFRKNGSTVANASCSNCSTASSGASSDFSVGGVGDYAARWSGKIAEILIYQSALSSQDVQKIEAYLSQKYQILTPVSASRSGSGLLGLNTSEQIQAVGGNPPYSYSVSGGGSISSSGLYTSPASGMGTSTVSVTDSSSTPQTVTLTIGWKDPTLLVCNETVLSEDFSSPGPLTSTPYSDRWTLFNDGGDGVLSLDAGALKVVSSYGIHFGGGLITKISYDLGVEASMDLFQTGTYGCGSNDCNERGIYFYRADVTPTRDVNYGNPMLTLAQGGAVYLLNSMTGRALLTTTGVFGSTSLQDIGTYPLGSFQNLKVKINPDNTFVISHKGVSVKTGTLAGNALSSPFKMEFSAGNYSSSSGAITFKMDNITIVRTEAGCP